MILTEKYTLQACKEIWTAMKKTDLQNPPDLFIGVTVENLKAHHAERLFKAHFQSNCPACEKVKQDNDGHLLCDSCILLELWTGGDDDLDPDVVCESNPESPFAKVKVAVGRKDQKGFEEACQDIIDECNRQLVWLQQEKQ